MRITINLETELAEEQDRYRMLNKRWWVNAPKSAETTAVMSQHQQCYGGGKGVILEIEKRRR